MTASAKVKDAAQGSGMVAHALRYVRVRVACIPLQAKNQGATS